MLKWVRRIFVFLLLGAMMNVAVAWGCVISAPDAPATPRVFRDPHLPDSATIAVSRQFGYRRIDNTSPVLDMSLVLSNQIDVNPEFTGLVWWPGTDRDAWNSEVRNIAGGWPLLAVRARYQFGIKSVAESFNHPADAEALGWEHAINLGAFGWPEIVLPIRPIVIGFAVDSLFYGLVLAAATSGLIGLRRTVRTRRHRCPACGYPRGSSPVCTECGEALPC